jgi:hypothetical protein
MISRSTHFMMPISARTGGQVKPTFLQGKRIQIPKFPKGVIEHATTHTLHLRPADVPGRAGDGRPAALAVSPHFINASAAVNSDGSLAVNFKEAGLGTNELISYTAAAQGTATWVCVNKGGANPSAQNKTTVNGPVSATGSFSSGKNGNVTASLTIQPPPSDITCPNGQKLQLASATYTGVSITDTTTRPNVTESIPGTFSTGCLLPNVRGAC